MKSLQIVTPHIECIYNCPFCIAKAHKHENGFKDNYHYNFELWKKGLEKVLNENKDLKFVVITGTNEPMQSKDCVNDIIEIVRKNRDDISIEIQTRWYKEDETYNKLNTVCYSISNKYFLDKIKPMGEISRYVIILTDSFNDKSLEDIINKLPEGVEQITFKILQNSILNNTKIDEWINSHNIDIKTLNKLEEDINNYCGNLSIRLDKNCMDAENRYKVFREDGYLYNDWDELPNKYVKL